MKPPARLAAMLAITLALMLPRLAAATYELKNNQPFPLHTPVSITQQQSLPDGVWSLDDGGLAQSRAGTLHLVATIPASGVKRLTLQKNAALAPAAPTATKPHLSVDASKSGAGLRLGAQSLGTLAWGIVLKPADLTTGGLARPGSLPLDYAGTFSALPLNFKKEASGPVFDLWTGEAGQDGLVCTVTLRVWHAGFLDIDTHVLNRSASATKKVYAALVCRWEQPETPARTLDYDNRIITLDANACSPFRAGKGRHLHVQRGADWLRSVFANGSSVAWIYNFPGSFTVRDDTAKNSFKQPRYTGGSLPQLGQEIQTAGPAVYSITEIARPNIRSYRDRVIDNVLPAAGDSVRFASRMIFATAPAQLDDTRVTQHFLACNSARLQTRQDAATRVEWGVPGVRFGTSYFPYSTLGENFDRKKLPGMDREAFWPLAADTVLRWREFADEIRRDLRIAKHMGFERIRLHHLELLAAIPDETRAEYLDFFFGELRTLHLKAMPDVYGAPESIGALVRRHADVIDTIELENEILIWGIPLDRPAQWKAIYETVKQIEPRIKVHLTSHTNTAIFNRLDELRVPHDNISIHAYIDSPDALPSGRGFALAAAAQAARANKPAVITEWNWRDLTRLTPGERIVIYNQIYESALATRSIAEMHQFQFQETLCPNPRIGRGNILRHYEMLNLSRRPKLEAFAFMDIIRKYCCDDNPVRTIETSPQSALLRRHAAGNATATAGIPLANKSNKLLRLKLTAETTADLRATLRATSGAQSAQPAQPAQTAALTLPPGGKTTIHLEIQTTAAAPPPGFYHAFVRIEDIEDDTGEILRYAWVVASLPGAPQIDTAAETTVTYPRGIATELNLDFAAPCVVVYAENAPVLEVETAIAIASTLESATGIPTEAYSDEKIDLARHKGATLIAVGSAKNLLTITTRHGIPALKLPLDKKTFAASLHPADGSPLPVLIIGGQESRDVEDAGMDFVLRYWMSAKDSAARKVGLIEKDLPRGFDPAKLP
jgi:hypothetical protein